MPAQTLRFSALGDRISALRGCTRERIRGVEERLRARPKRTRAAVRRPEMIALGLIVLVGLVLRLYFLEQWRPALVGCPDTTIYVQDARAGIFNDPLHVGGYSEFLRLMHGIRAHLSFAIFVQHLLGLASGLFPFGAVRRAGLPAGLGFPWTSITRRALESSASARLARRRNPTICASRGSAGLRPRGRESARSERRRATCATRSTATSTGPRGATASRSRPASCTHPPRAGSPACTQPRTTDLHELAQRRVKLNRAVERSHCPVGRRRVARKADGLTLLDRRAVQAVGC
jgi:hypothetical protein